MRSKYSNLFKHEVCQLICEEGRSTLLTAEELGIPLKTVENWITAYHKNPECYKRPDNYYAVKRREFADRYNNLDISMLVTELKRRDTEIEFLRSMLKVKDLRMERMEEEYKKQSRE